MKICKTCFVEKVDKDFYREPNNTDGLKGECKPCYRERTRIKYWLNPEAERERKRVKRPQEEGR
jgi:hypothetical protein